MNIMINRKSLKELAPSLSDLEKREILAYHKVYEQYADEFARTATEKLTNHPIFGKLIAHIPEEDRERTNKLSRQLQQDAIINNNWEPYIEYQIEQGISYAKMGLSFKAWYEVVALMRKYLTPYLLQEYGQGPEFLSAFNGMNIFIDIAMGIIGEAYVQEKKERGEEEVLKLNQELEQKVIARTEQYESLNKEMTAFTYSISHDLRAPLRAVNGYAKMLIEEYGPGLDDEARRIMENIKKNSSKMGMLIDDLLAFSRLGRKEVQKRNIDMNELVANVLTQMNRFTVRRANLQIGQLPEVKADYNLIFQAMVNLISNAIKYSSKKDNPVIEVSATERDDEFIFIIRDNGAGFDMQYMNKLFAVFERLHSDDEFEGTGVGLAIVKSIIVKHGGRVWAEGIRDQGAVFYFSLPKN